MSVVEKAAEKLKILQSDSSVPPRAEPNPGHAAPTVERLQQRVRGSDDVAHVAEPWHVDQTALKRVGIIPADDQAADLLTDELRRVKRGK